MAEQLHVIALISGGKDSFFSILHCMRHGHKVVALANLYPEVPHPPPSSGEARAGEETEQEEQDLNSFMFQTVGHTVIPLYEQALGIPLYRQQISGSAVQTGTSYSHIHISPPSSSEVGDPQAAEDETESLVPLLKKAMQEHPSANALSMGAILSTYQRTRVESVALRLGLQPLSYLWKYPILPPGMQTSLLDDMRAVGMDARIIKVASGGLDESFLWENVASASAVRRIEKAMARFGSHGDGAVLGEGGEFETLAIDGPLSLFKRRIDVRDGDWAVVREGGGSAWLRVVEAKSVLKAPETVTEPECRIPDLFDRRFEDILEVLQKEELRDQLDGMETLPNQSMPPYDFPSVVEVRQGDVLYWTITAKDHTGQSISDEAGKIISELKRRLSQESLRPSDITSSTIVLRSMEDFQAVNNVYGAVFTHPDPPSRVTISCGPAMPTGLNIILHLKVSPQTLLRQGLHVQSRSYWAPANIGPYSQAISTNHSSSSSQDSPWTVHIAGQIPLIPSSMQLPSPSFTAQETFSTQTILSLQHLFRIASETQTQHFTSAAAYLPRSSPLPISSRAIIAGRAWTLAHTPTAESDDEDDDEDSAPDLWEAKHNYQNHQDQYLSSRSKNDSAFHGSGVPPPFFAVEVESLPRGAGVEWHAHVGLTGSSSQTERAVQVTCDEGPGWKMDHCRSATGRTYSVFRLFWDARSRGFVDVVGKEGLYISYVDVSVESELIGKMGREIGINIAGMMPCRSIWDGDGRRIAAVLLFDKVVSE